MEVTKSVKQESRDFSRERFKIMDEIEYVNIEDVSKRYDGKFTFEQITKDSLTVINNDTKLAVAEIPMKFVFKINGKTYADFKRTTRYLPSN